MRGSTSQVDVNEFKYNVNKILSAKHLPVNWVEPVPEAFPEPVEGRRGVRRNPTIPVEPVDWVESFPELVDCAAKQSIPWEGHSEMKTGDLRSNPRAR
jgi:hypothetical protein